MNPRIRPLSDDQAPAAARAVLQQTAKAMGMVPNLHRTLAHSGAALRAYHETTRSLAGGELPPRLREQIAVAVAGWNGCSYCASAHTLLGQNAGLDASELACNLRGESDLPEASAALAFVRELLERRGAVDDATLQALRAAGFDDAQVVEIVAHVGMNIFTNYFNNLAGTTIDFPVVQAAARRAEAR